MLVDCRLAITMLHWICHQLPGVTLKCRARFATAKPAPEQPKCLCETTIPCPGALILSRRHWKMPQLLEMTILFLEGAHTSACSMKVPSRVPQGDRQTVLHSGDTAQNVPVDMGVGRLTAQFLWYQTISTTAFQVEKLLQTGQVTADRCV